MDYLGYEYKLGLLCTSLFLASNVLKILQSAQKYVNDLVRLSSPLPVSVSPLFSNVMYTVTDTIPSNHVDIIIVRDDVRNTVLCVLN